MITIDMHELTVENAIDKFIQIYNENIGKSIKIIHGYGSTGKGGKIKKRLRQFLEMNSKFLEYIIGEKIDGNRGYTVVNAKKRIPLKIDYIKIEILEFCNTAKTKEKIAGKFRKYEPEKILKALKRMEKSGEIKIINKGKHKCYIRE